MKKDIISILKDGLIATTAMTLLMLVAPMMGMPKMPIGEMLAGFMHIPVALGWVMHFMVGTILAAAHQIVWKNRLPVNAAVNGMIFSLIPFLIAQSVVMPVMGAGFFSMNTPAPVMMVMGSLIGHLVYGAVLGAVTK
ncbi:MAG: DUF2938 family protein [Calditrichia bacterium]|nr:DUF2938 family protein [Calditrichia bacterium]